MAENIRLNKKQVAFLMYWVDEDPEKAAEKFMELMLEQKVPTSQICEYIDKIIERNKDKK